MRSLKRGSMLDPVIWVILSFVTVLFLALWFYAFGLITNQLVAIDTPVGDGTTNVSAIATDTFGNVNIGLRTLKILSFVIIFSMIISIFVSNFLINVHPVFFIPYMFFNVLAIILSVIVSNTYEGLLTGQAFSSALQEFSASTFVMLHLPVFTTVVGFIGMIILMMGVTRDAELGGPI